jgi:hypothetical protein
MAPANTKRMKEGTLVAFDEIYIAEIGNEKLGQMVKAESAGSGSSARPGRSTSASPDPQGKAARMDWKAMGLKTVWHTTREFDEHIKAIRAMFDDELFYCVGERAPSSSGRSSSGVLMSARATSSTSTTTRCRTSATPSPTSRRSPEGAMGTAGSLAASSKFLVSDRRSADLQDMDAPVRFQGGPNEFDRWRRVLGAPIQRESEVDASSSLP